MTLAEAMCLGVPAATWGQNERQHFMLSDIALHNGCLDLGLGTEADPAATAASLAQWLGPEGQEARQEQVRDGMALGPWTLNAAPDWWEEEKAGQVRIGTVHSFKGLEADVVIYLGMAYPSGRAARLAYTAYSRARHRLIVLEQAIPKPKRVEPAAAAAPAATPAVTASPVRPQVRSFDERQREALMGALSAAKRWKPGGNRQGPRRGPSAGFGST